MDALITLINASFDKLAFVTGAIFLMVAVFCKKSVTLGSLQLPPIDKVGRVTSGLVGIPLVLWAVFVWTAQSGVNLRLISIPPPEASEVIQQELPKQVRLSTGEGIGIFVYNITSAGSSYIVLFNLDDRARSVIDRDTSYNSLRNTVHIVWQQDATQGRIYQFTYQGRNHKISVDEVYWYLIGPDYVIVTIE